MERPEMLNLAPHEVRPFDLIDEGRVVTCVHATDVGVLIESCALRFVIVETSPSEYPRYWDLDRGADHRDDYYSIEDGTYTRIRVMRGAPLHPPSDVVR